MSKPYVFSGLILLLLSSSALARPISCQIGGSQINIDSWLVANISVPARLEIERQIKPLLLITDHEKNHDFVGQNQTLKPNTMRRLKASNDRMEKYPSLNAFGPTGSDIIGNEVRQLRQIKDDDFNEIKSYAIGLHQRLVCIKAMFVAESEAL
tara:strand:- start:922 stop:1380 length:459 start_codon:yes stop_codon:yes gene_type:complete